MSHRKILFLTALVLLLFAFIFLFERKMPTTSEAEQKKELVWDLPEDDVETIRLEKPGSLVELKRSGPASWRLVRPEAYPADSGAAGDLAAQLAKLRRSGESAEARPEDYGFAAGDGKSAPPSALKATLVSKDPANPSQRHTRTVEFGIEIPGKDEIAARVGGNPRIFFLPLAVATAARRGADEFRSKDVFGGGPGEVAKVEIERGRGRVVLSKKSGLWWLSQPVADLADADFAQRFVDELTGLKALEFVGAADRQNLSTLGLAPALYRVTLSDGKPTTVVDFGATRSDGNSVYARRDSQVLTVSSTVVEDLSKEAVVFREPRLVRFDRAAVASIEGAFGAERVAFARKESGWVSDGRPMPAASADDLMTAVLDLKSRAFLDDAAAAGLKDRAPSATWTVRLASGESWTIQLFPIRGESEATVSGRPGAFQLDSDALSRTEAAFRKAAGKKG
ncbi:MAG: DUF4340 domain-containing protein [Acidobacteriota bacterium]